MIITLITVGTLKEDYLKDAVAEYKKRLTQYARVEEVGIKEEPIRDENKSATPNTIINTLILGNYAFAIPRRMRREAYLPGSRNSDILRPR